MQNETSKTSLFEVSPFSHFSNSHHRFFSYFPDFNIKILIKKDGIFYQYYMIKTSHVFIK